MRQLLRGGLGNRSRLVHTVLATALSVSLLAGTLMFADTIRAAFRTASTVAADGADLTVRSTAEFTSEENSFAEREPVPASLLAQVEAVTGVRSAWGMVWGFAQLLDERGRSVASKGLPTTGSAWSPTDTVLAGRPPSGPGDVAIDAGLAEEQGLGLGDRVKVLFEEEVASFSVAGLRPVGGMVPSTAVAFELETSQRLLGRQERFDAIAVRVADGVSPDAARSRMAAVLPDVYEVVTSEQTAREARQSWARALQFLQPALLVLTAVSLFVGALIIANTFSVLVSQRSRELGLLRAVGASRAQVLVAVLAEATGLGVVASAIGVAAGGATARGLVVLMEAAGLDLPTAGVVFLPRTVLAGLACGVAFTVGAALLPAWRATRASVAGGLDDSGEARGARRVRLVVGGCAILAGGTTLAARLILPAQATLATVGAGALGLLVGLSILLPVLARPAARLIGGPMIRLFGQTALLARGNAMRNPRRTGATAAALMIGIGLVGVIAILAASMKASAQRSVHETLRADFVIRSSAAAGRSAGVPPVAAARLRQTPGVAAVSEFRGGQWGLEGAAQTLVAVDPATLADVQQLQGVVRAMATRLNQNQVMVRRSVAASHGWRKGDHVPMTFARTGTQHLEIVGTFSTAAPTDYVVSLDTFEANYARQLDAEIQVRLSPTVSSTTGRHRIEAALADLANVDVLDRSQLLRAQDDQVDRLLMPVSALLAMSVLIALLGIANTLSLSLHERTREIGLLRSIGMGRRQLRSMIRSEAVIIAVLGALLGVVVATVLGWSLVTALRVVGVTELVFPVWQLLGWVVVAAMAGLVAGILPARRAARLPVLDAVTAA